MKIRIQPDFVEVDVPVVLQAALRMPEGPTRSLAMLKVAWTGREAFYVSLPGNYGEVPYSELAMHTRVAGKKVVAYALFDRIKGPAGVPDWAHVLTEADEPGKLVVTDGLPSEVLPWAVQQNLPVNFFGADYGNA